MKKPIEIITNHKNLLGGFNNKPTLSKRHIQWLEILKNFNYVMGYCPGNKNTVADILSRRSDHYTTEESFEPFKLFPEDKMIPIEQLEIAALDFGLDESEWSQGLEWAYLCAIESDATLTEEMKVLTKDSDPKDENGRT